MEKNKIYWSIDSELAVEQPLVMWSTVKGVNTILGPNGRRDIGERLYSTKRVHNDSGKLESCWTTRGQAEYALKTALLREIEHQDIRLQIMKEHVIELNKEL